MAWSLRRTQPDRTAIVLGGGGVRGAVEIGMVRALFEAGIRPDLVVGTSIGAINGALIAKDPTLGVIQPLLDAWTSPEANAVYGSSLFMQMSRLVKTKTHLNSHDPLRRLLEASLGRGDPLRRSRGAASGRRREHRARLGARLRLRAADPRDPRVSVRARPLPTDAHRRRALHRRRHRQLDPHRAGRGLGRDPDLRAAGRPGRDSARRPVDRRRDGPRRLRDRAAPPLRARPRHAARWRRSLRAADRRPAHGDDSIRAYRKLDTVLLRIEQAHEASRDFLYERGMPPLTVTGAAR